MTQILSNAVDYAPATTILVVEDEVMIRMAVAEDLRACGFIVREAASAPAAIEVLKRDDEVDAVFSDVHMPGYVNGVGLAQWILVHKPQVTVVLTSAAFESSNLPDELRRSVRMVSKPYECSSVLRQFRLSGISGCETELA
jgi:CheY-like chemotaxis protein